MPWKVSCATATPIVASASPAPCAQRLVVKRVARKYAIVAATAVVSPWMRIFGGGSGAGVARSRIAPITTPAATTARNDAPPALQRIGFARAGDSTRSRFPAAAAPSTCTGDGAAPAPLPSGIHVSSAIDVATENATSFA